MTMTRSEFERRVRARVQATDERRGQAAFNVAKEFVGVCLPPADVDPFYDESRYEAFVAWLAEAQVLVYGS